MTVYDWRSGQVVYGVDGGAPFDVQPDRTLAFETTGASPQIAWASPAEPSPHPLASARAFDVRIANGRVAIRTGSQFEVFDLSGSELAATPAADAAGSFDFDGTQLVYASQPCKVAAIVTWDLGAPPPASASGSCPYARASTAVDDLRHRRLAVPVRCPGIPALGCSGIWAVVLYDPYFHDLGGRLEALDPGQTATLRVRLSRRDACLLEKHRVRRATIDLSPDGLRRPTGRYRPPLLPLTTRGRARACR